MDLLVSKQVKNQKKYFNLFFHASNIYIYILKLKIDKTCIMVSINGPIEIKARKEEIDRATIEVLCKPITGLISLKH